MAEFFRWPKAIRKHYMRHYQAGLQALLDRPCKTPEERVWKFPLTEAWLRRRVLRHVEKMHPEHFL